MVTIKEVDKLSRCELDVELRKIGEELKYINRRRIIEGGEPTNDLERYYQEIWIKVQQKNGD